MAKKDQYSFSDEDEAQASETDTVSQRPEAEYEQEERNSNNETTQSKPSTSVRDAQNLPLKFRRDGVKEFRQGNTFHLQQETRQAVQQVERILSDTYPDEKMYKLDVYEIIVLNGIFTEGGQIDEEGLRHQAERMGYGLKSSD